MSFAGAAPFVLSAALALGPTSAAPLPQAENAGTGTPTQIIRLTDSAGEPTAVPQAEITAITAGKGERKLHRTLPQNAPIDTPALLTEPIATNDFLVSGLTWSGSADLPDGTEIFIRVREADSWSQWYLTEPEEAAPRDDTADRHGTEPFVTAGSDAVQVMVLGDSASLPTDLDLALVPADPGGFVVADETSLPVTTAERTDVNRDSLAEKTPAEVERAAATVRTAQGGAAALSAPTNTEPTNTQAPMSGNGAGAMSEEGPSPSGARGMSLAGASIRSALAPAASVSDVPIAVVSRASWGADESWMDWEREYFAAPFVVVHHTAGTNNYTMDQSDDIVRGIYSYHARSLGWGDIGYNFLVDKWGRVFEGRSGSLAAPKGQMVEGGHARGYNQGTMAISMMGDYQSLTPSKATINSVGRIAGWQLSRANVADAFGSGYYAHKNVTIRRLVGHRDVNSTACPGDAAYAQMDQIRTTAQSVISGNASQSPGAAAAPVVKSGWIAEYGGWRYYSEKGQLHKGWLAHNGNWYYLDATSGFMRTGRLTLKGLTYFFDSSGAMRIGWLRVGDSWRFYAADGHEVKGWLSNAGKWYYLDPATGLMRTEWISLASKWYYLDPDSGAMTTKWLADRGSWYYLDPANGEMRIGRIAVDSSKYYMASTGAMRTGWIPIEKSWRYYASDGHEVTGWLADEGNWYYLDPATGLMRTGTLKINGVTYSFASSGAWIRR